MFSGIGGLCSRRYGQPVILISVCRSANGIASISKTFFIQIPVWKGTSFQCLTIWRCDRTLSFTNVFGCINNSTLGHIQPADCKLDRSNSDHFSTPAYEKILLIMWWADGVIGWTSDLLLFSSDWGKGGRKLFWQVVFDSGALWNLNREASSYQF